MFLLPFHMVGLSRETTDTQQIGRLGATPEALRLLLARANAIGAPCVALGTCNRVELYWWGEADLAPVFRAWAAARRVGDDVPPLEERDADRAVRHLFAVASGLLSQRVGEPEILGQVRQAWLSSRDAGYSAPPLDSLMQRAILAARQVRAQSGFEGHDASLGEVAVRLLTRELLGEPAGEVARAHAWSGKSALVVGSGVAADCVVRALQVVRPASITIVSRTDQRAGRLADSLEVQTAPWSSFGRMLAQSDVVVFATRATDPLVGVAQANALQRQRTRDTLWLDLGVPPNVAPEVGAALSTALSTALSAALGADRGAQRLRLRTLADLPTDTNALVVRRAQRALQEEMARFAADLQRRSMANRLPHIEEQASAVARDTVQRLQCQLSAAGDWAQHESSTVVDAAALSVARRITWLLMRELGMSDATVSDVAPAWPPHAVTLAE